jgi:L-seryl-tRNA(Ser) seleniumtransferase
MRTLPALVTLVLAAVLTLPVRAQEKPAEVAGTWAITVETAAGSGTPTLTLEQNAEKLTGTYSSQVFGEQKVTGTIKGNAITFTFTGAVEGNSITVTYTGTVDGSTMKGKVSLGELGEGTFTAKKK